MVARGPASVSCFAPPWLQSPCPGAPGWPVWGWAGLWPSCLTRRASGRWFTPTGRILPDSISTTPRSSGSWSLRSACLPGSATANARQPSPRDPTVRAGFALGAHLGSSPGRAQPPGTPVGRRPAVVCAVDDRYWYSGHGDCSRDAGVRSAGADRQGRECLLRRWAHPALAQDRLRQSDAEHLVDECPQPGPGGSARSAHPAYCAASAPPASHQGVLAPNALLRQAVTALAAMPKPPPAETDAVAQASAIRPAARCLGAPAGAPRRRVCAHRTKVRRRDARCETPVL